MARKRIRVSRGRLFTWLALAGFIFLFAPQGLTGKFQTAFARIFRWPLSIGRSISLSASAPQLLTDVVSRREYNQLQNYLANVTEELNQERRKREKLADLRDRFGWDGFDFRLADVITAAVDGRGELIIDRGKDDALAVGQFVLGDNSVIGTVWSVDGKTARVKLFTDPKSQLAVNIAGLKTVMQGFGGNKAKLKMVPVKYKIKTGEAVCAAKKPDFLDAPIIVGKVTACKRGDENPLLWDITVEPACNVEELSSVAVIILKPQK